MIGRLLGRLLLVGFLGPCAWAGEEEQVRMLKQILFLPGSMEAVLRSNRELLDSSFFERIEERVKWGLATGQIEDALRFARLGDCALQVIGKTPRLCSDLLLWRKESDAQFADLVAQRLAESRDFFANIPAPARDRSRGPTEEQRALDLSTEDIWEVKLPGSQTYSVGQSLYEVPYTLGDHDQPFIEQLPGLNSRPQPSSVLSMGRPESQVEGVWSGVRQGRRVWVASWWPETELQCGGESVARLVDPLQDWKARLGPQSARFATDDSRRQVLLFRAAMADVGLVTEGGDVLAFILMEPGHLRTHIIRLGFRELD